MSECAPQLHSRGKQKVKKKKKKLKLGHCCFLLPRPLQLFIHTLLIDYPPARQGIPGLKWGALERVIVFPVQFSAEDWKDQRGFSDLTRVTQPVPTDPGLEHRSLKTWVRIPSVPTLGFNSHAP